MKFRSKALIGLFILTVLTISTPFNAWGAEANDSSLSWSAAKLVAFVTSAVSPAIRMIFWTFGLLARILIDWLAMGLVPMFTVDSFIDAPVVKIMWPIVLGIANLGFLLALIVIALLVTLRLDVGGGIRKLLPRLLLGAILINFSLIICGLVLDFSKLLMAIIAAIFDVESLDKDLFIQVYSGSGVLDIRDNIVKLNQLTGAWDSAVGAIVVAVLLWIMVIALAVVLFTLVVRYFVLLILIILSPFAYIALAFPGTQKITVAWWSAFLKYVAYGPLALLFLLMALKTSELLPMDTFDQSKVDGQIAYVVLKTIIFTAGLILAAMAGRYASIIGSKTALDIASRTGKKARSIAYKSAYVGSGARRAGREARAIGSKATEPIRKTFGLGEYSKFDPKTGKLKKGKTTALGVGEKLQQATGALHFGRGAGGAKHKKVTTAAKDMQDNIKTGTPVAIKQTSLMNETAAKRLSEPEVKSMTRGVMVGGNEGQKMNLVSNVEIVRKMDDAAKAAVLDSNDKELIKTLNANLRRIESEI